MASLEDDLLRRAEDGDVQAQLYLGWAYDRNGKFEYDAEKAEFWLIKAASHGDIGALRRLASFQYAHDKPATLETALRLVNVDDFFGHYLLGVLFVHGDCDVARDLNKGLHHLEIAGSKGHLISQALAARHKPANGLFAKLLKELNVLRLTWRSSIMMWRKPHDPSVHT